MVSFDINMRLMLNGIVRNSSVVIFKIVLTKTMDVLNWIVWMGTVWLNRIVAQSAGAVEYTACTIADG